MSQNTDKPGAARLPKEHAVANELLWTANNFFESGDATILKTGVKACDRFLKTTTSDFKAMRKFVNAEERDWTAADSTQFRLEWRTSWPNWNTPNPDDVALIKRQLVGGKLTFPSSLLRHVVLEAIYTLDQRRKKGDNVDGAVEMAVCTILRHKEYETVNGPLRPVDNDSWRLVPLRNYVQKMVAKADQSNNDVKALAGELVLTTTLKELYEKLANVINSSPARTIIEVLADFAVAHVQNTIDFQQERLQMILDVLNKSPPPRDADDEASTVKLVKKHLRWIMDSVNEWERKFTDGNAADRFILSTELQPFWNPAKEGTNIDSIEQSTKIAVRFAIAQVRGKTKDLRDMLEQVLGEEDNEGRKHN